MLTVEKLLNSLIEKGWKPRDIETLYIEVKLKYGELHLILPQMGHLWKPIRLLVSKESGLRQFCIENNLINKYADLGPDVEEAYIGKWKNGLDAVDINGNYIRLDDDYDEYHQDTDYKYRLIESALKDESELEDFLLSNIVIKDEE